MHTLLVHQRLVLTITMGMSLEKGQIVLIRNLIRNPSLLPLSLMFVPYSDFSTSDGDFYRRASKSI